MSSRLLAALFLISAACTHNDVSLGGPATLVRIDHEPSGANCEHGGVAIRTGLDQDGDMYLDDGEITSTQYVCNGSSPVQCAGGVIETGTIAIGSKADADALAGVNCIDGDLLVSGLTGDDLGSLSNLAIVTGDVVVAGNPGLPDLTGLGALREIGGQYLIQGNDGLTDLTGLENVDRVTAINVVGNDHLLDLHGLEHLTDFAGDLTIASNIAMTDLTGLENLVLCKGSIAIRGNLVLGSLDRLAKLRQVTLIEISGNGGLQTFTLDALEKVDVRLLVNQDGALTSASFPSLVTTGSFVQFQDDPALTTISIPTLVTTGGLLVGRDNNLTTIDLPALVYVTGQLNLVTLPALTSLVLPELVSIGGDTTFTQVSALQHFSSFPKLTSIGGTLTVSSSSGPIDFGGFAALTSIAGNMLVTANGALTSFAGLDALTEINGSLTITNNPVLPTAVANAFGTRVIVRGTKTISGNHP